MSKLEDVVSENPLALKQTTEIVNKGVYEIAAGFLASNKAAEFSGDVSKFIASKKFSAELSKAVGEPRAEESEDEFVGRAKEAMRNLLKKKFL